MPAKGSRRCLRHRIWSVLPDSRGCSSRRFADSPLWTTDNLPQSASGFPCDSKAPIARF
jgi:hypothetical protein